MEPSDAERTRLREQRREQSMVEEGGGAELSAYDSERRRSKER